MNVFKKTWDWLVGKKADPSTSNAPLVAKDIDFELTQKPAVTPSIKESAVTKVLRSKAPARASSKKPTRGGKSRGKK